MEKDNMYKEKLESLREQLAALYQSEENVKLQIKEVEKLMQIAQREVRAAFFSDPKVMRELTEILEIYGQLVVSRHSGISDLSLKEKKAVLMRSLESFTGINLNNYPYLFDK